MWGSISNSKIESLQRFQDRAISIIDTARIKDDWSKNLSTVKQLIMYDRSVMTYKIMNRLCPENLWNNFQRRSHYSNYNTRFCEHSKKSFVIESLHFHGYAFPNPSLAIDVYDQQPTKSLIERLLEILTELPCT